MKQRYEIRFKSGERERFEKCAAAEHMDLAAWIRFTLHRAVDRFIGEESAGPAVLTEEGRIQDIVDSSPSLEVTNPTIEEKAHD